MISLLSCFSWVNRHVIFRCWQKVSVLQVVKIPFHPLQAQKSQGNQLVFFRRVEERGEAVRCSPMSKVFSKFNTIHKFSMLYFMDSQIFSV